MNSHAYSNRHLFPERFVTGESDGNMLNAMSGGIFKLLSSGLFAFSSNISLLLPVWVSSCFLTLNKERMLPLCFDLTVISTLHKFELGLNCFYFGITTERGQK